MHTILYVQNHIFNRQHPAKDDCKSNYFAHANKFCTNLHLLRTHTHPHIHTHPHPHTDLSQENGHGDNQLVDGADGSAQRHWRNLRQVHRGQAGVESGVDADDEAAGDEHLVAAGHLGEAHEEGGDDHQDIVEEQAALPTQPAVIKNY